MVRRVATIITTDAGSQLIEGMAALFQDGVGDVKCSSFDMIPLLWKGRRRDFYCFYP